MSLKDTELKKLFCLCIHGHFYQPPRDNPSLEIIEIQKSAAPFHDWNERITRECYGPNTRARLHGFNGRITRLINNYAYMSFDFGPTLLSWLEDAYPWVYSQILAADKEGQKRYHGHGNAIAHVYNHIIMPLASRRDKLTQIRWGMADFRHRFGRESEGMWLAETAVDMESLELMVDEGIKFTILSPDQALAVRPIDAGRGSSGDVIKDPSQRAGGWNDVKGGRIDPSRPYRVFLNKKANKYIDVFFYDGPLSRAIAYEQVLASGEALMGRIKGILEHHKEGPRILSIATDGESYGHHFKFGEMALSWLFDRMEREGQIKLVNFGYFLELSPPQQEVRIIDKSSWSCAHGVERWRSDCGCNVGGKKEWNQKWREPLRNGMDWLSRELSIIFEYRAGRLLKNPWDARNEYITILLNDSDAAAFLSRHSIRPLNQEEKTEAFCLLESQRMALYMFTSCGWFFDDISGIESIQILLYAARAIELIRRTSPNDLEKGLLDFLAHAESNDPAFKNGATIYKTMVSPAKITPSRTVAHFGIISLLDGINSDRFPLVKMVQPLRRNNHKINGIKAILGEVLVIEKRTEKQTGKTFLAIRGNDQSFSCVTGIVAASDYELINNEIAASLSESSESLITIFSMSAQDVQYFTLADLIADVRHDVIKSMADTLYDKIAASMYAEKEMLEEFVGILHSINESPPSRLNNVFGIFISGKFSDLLSGRSGDKLIDFNKFLDFVNHFLSETGSSSENTNGMQALFLETMKEPVYKLMAQDFLLKNLNQFAESGNYITLQNVINFLKFIDPLGIRLDLWECQNIFYDTYMGSDWMKKDNLQLRPAFLELGLLLGFLIEEK
jgi:alpha-amylase/alpha-mannosidase (GH57 family)